jgi:transcriptional regulator with GAF, ATPase, and Fis domain
MSGDDNRDDLELLAEAARARGDAVFPALASALAGILGASRALISELVSDAVARTHAVRDDGKPCANYQYDLAGLPCALVARGDAVHIRAALREHFPRVPGEFTSYFGLPLISSEGEVSGHLAAYGMHDLPVSTSQLRACEILAGLATAELQKLRTGRGKARLLSLNQYLQHEIESVHNFREIIGNSAGIERVLEAVSRVATTDVPVLITGEAGTGKELFARAVHFASRRAARPLIKFNCAALAAGFGADEASSELANGATMFLDEIGALQPDAQARLLRLLVEQEAERADDGAARVWDVRVIASTNRDLSRAVRAGSFREDLYYRLNVFPIELPPLRARPDDIAQLVQFFAHKHGARLGYRVDGVDPDTLASLKGYSWPGNVRELENLVERALLLNPAPLLKIPPEMFAVLAPMERADVAAAATGMHRTLSMSGPALPAVNLDDLESTGLHHVQREHILRVLNATRWVIEGNSGAALKLGMKPATLRHRMKKLGIARAGTAPSPEIR